jgi:hypothetical protein
MRLAMNSFGFFKKDLITALLSAFVATFCLVQKKMPGVIFKKTRESHNQFRGGL